MKQHKSRRLLMLALEVKTQFTISMVPSLDEPLKAVATYRGAKNVLF